MSQRKPHHSFERHQAELAEAAYEHLLSRHTSKSWCHVAPRASRLADHGRMVARRLGIDWEFTSDYPGSSHSRAKHCFVDGELFRTEDLRQLIESSRVTENDVVLAGTGFYKSRKHRQAILEACQGGVSLLASSLWWSQSPSTVRPPPDQRGAVCVPCFQDNWRIEENLAWRHELLAGLDVHICDDNFAPAEIDRLGAISRACGWHYHPPGGGEHPDYTNQRSEFAAYNRFIWRSLTRLADNYDFVIKLDTDACLLEPSWWHEAACRLHNRAAMLGTYDFRPLYEVAYFWHVAWRHGYSPALTAFPLHLQGGMYAISGSGLQRLRAMGFLPGPHFDFTEDGYISYCAQLLGIELLPAITFGSWSRLKRPPWDGLDHLKAIHPLMRRDRDRVLTR